MKTHDKDISTVTQKRQNHRYFPISMHEKIITKHFKESFAWKISEGLFYAFCYMPHAFEAYPKRFWSKYHINNT